MSSEATFQQEQTQSPNGDNAVVTIEDMYDVPQDGRKYELIKGEVKVSPAGMIHEQVGVKLIFLLMLYLRENKIGGVYGSSVGFSLPSGDLLSPDVSFVRTDRLPGGKIPDSFGTMSPDLAVEIVSPGDSMTDVEDKVDLYLSNGSALVWVINPRSRRAIVYRAGKQPRVLQGDDTLDGDDVLPEFSCMLSELFES
jgi:Uma2 family endonuclease